MFANERYDEIEKIIGENGSVTVKELTSRYGVSAETVRRDLCYLEECGRLRRVHGGAVAKQKMRTLKRLCERLDENNDKKLELSNIAAQLIREGDIIAIDSGSTAVIFANVLKQRFRHLKIVTNSTDLFEIFRNCEGFEIVMTGGSYLREEEALYGTLAVSTIKSLHCSKAFVFPIAVSLQNGLYDFHETLVPVQRAYMSCADTVVVMADSTKLEKTGFIKLCDMERSFIYVTDSALDDTTAAMYEENGIDLRRQKGKCTDENKKRGY